MAWAGILQIGPFLDPTPSVLGRTESLSSLEVKIWTISFQVRGLQKKLLQAGNWGWGHCPRLPGLGEAEAVIMTLRQPHHNRG